MTVEEQEIARILREISERLARMQDVLNRIALGLGVRPDE